MYSCHLFLISSAIQFLSFIVPIFAWNAHLVSLIFLKRSLIFPILLLSSISLHCSLRKAFLYLRAIFWNPAFRWVYLSFTNPYFLYSGPHLGASWLKHNFASLWKHFMYSKNYHVYSPPKKAESHLPVWVMHDKTVFQPLLLNIQINTTNNSRPIYEFLGRVL